MSAGNETYVANACKAALLVEELWVSQGPDIAVQAQELFRRNPLAAGGYETVFIQSSAPAVPDVTIVSVTEPAVEGEEVTVIATTPVGGLTYKFELEFTPGNWLNMQLSSINTWTPAVGTAGFRWRVTVNATSGQDSDQETFTATESVQTPSSETILDVFSCTSQRWRSGNEWWNNLQANGAWASTGTITGDYFSLDGGAYFKTDWIRTGPAGASSLPLGSKLRITFGGQTTALPLATYTGLFTGGDLRFDWDGGAVAFADLEKDGNFGLKEIVPITIEVIAP